MNEEPLATRREVDQLRDEMRQAQADAKTVAVLSEQLATLARSLSDFKTAIQTRFEAHDKVHADAERERTASRRWLIGTCIAALTVLIGLYGWVALLLDHHHG